LISSQIFTEISTLYLLILFDCDKFTGTFRSLL